MSIHWLYDIEREIGAGKIWYACEGAKNGVWHLSRSREEIDRAADRAGRQRNTKIRVLTISLPDQAVPGDLFLVPTRINESSGNGEPNIEWSKVESLDGAEMVRDMRHGEAPYFVLKYN